MELKIDFYDLEETTYMIDGYSYNRYLADGKNSSTFLYLTSGDQNINIFMITRSRIVFYVNIIENIYDQEPYDIQLTLPNKDDY